MAIYSLAMRTSRFWPCVLRDFFGADRYGQLVERLGEPAEVECYFPVPYPASGGSGALDSYQKGNIWVHLDIYGQVIGL